MNSLEQQTYVQAHDILSPVAVVKFISVAVFAKKVSSNK